MKLITCKTCQIQLEVSSWNCACEVPNLIYEMNPILQSYVSLYSTFAADDLASHFQDENSLLFKAKHDFAAISNYISDFKNISVLEIGPGKGHLSSLFPENANYFCMDIVPEYLSHNGRKNFLGNIENLHDLFSGYFDLVIACDVFEHVLNEGRAWEEVHDMLSENGIFYLRVPSQEPLIHYANKEKVKFPFVHLRSYSAKILKINGYNHRLKPLKISKVFFGKFSFARRNFGLIKMYRKNATVLRYNLGFESDSDSSPKLEFRQKLISAANKSEVLRNKLLKLHSFLFYRETELIGIYRKERFPQ